MLKEIKDEHTECSLVGYLAAGGHQISWEVHLGWSWPHGKLISWELVLRDLVLWELILWEDTI